MNEKAIVVRDPSAGDQLQSDPEAVLDAAAQAARALQRVVESKPRKIMITGKQYLQFEDWQTLGQFYRYSVKTGQAVPVEVDGVRGAYAKAEVIDMRTGEMIGGADAYCMSDEENWVGKPWFQLASMAQTRAGAKALRNRLAWVAVLAGYEPTPAEEMTEDKPLTDKKPEHYCEKHSVAFRRFQKGDNVWYSHKDGDGWCNEAKARETSPTPPTKPTLTRTPPVEEAHEQAPPAVAQGPQAEVAKPVISAVEANFATMLSGCNNHHDLRDTFTAIWRDPRRKQLPDEAQARITDYKEVLKAEFAAREAKKAEIELSPVLSSERAEFDVEQEMLEREVTTF